MPGGDGSLSAFQIQRKHGDTVPAISWYHSGPDNSSQGSRTYTTSRNSRNPNLITDFARDLNTAGEEGKVAISVRKTENVKNISQF
jgi:hypothetical protein